MDSFPYDSWEEARQAALESGEGFFTFGPGGNTGSIVLAVLGIIVMVVAFVAFVVFEDRRLREHTERLNEGS